MKIVNTEITPKMIADFGLLVVVAVIGVYFLYEIHKIVQLLERIAK